MWLYYTETSGGDPENKPAENPGETEGAWGAEKDYRVSQGEFWAEEQLLAAEELFETQLGLSSVSQWGASAGALSVPLKPTVGNRLWSSSKSWVNGLILMLLSLCVLTALCTGSSGGQWEDLYWSDPLHWEKPLWGDTADQRSGEDCSESSRRTTEAIGAGDWRSEEERHWAGAAFTHRRSHPFPSGNRDLMNRRVVFRKGRACCPEIVFLSNVFVSLAGVFIVSLCLCSVSSLYLFLLDLQTHPASLSVLVSPLMMLKNQYLIWERNWSISAERR